MEKSFARYAANAVSVDGVQIEQCAVELSDGEVVRYFSFSGELPFTSWLQGTIELKKDSDSVMRAYYKGTLIK